MRIPLKAFNHFPISLVSIPIDVHLIFVYINCKVQIIFIECSVPQESYFVCHIQKLTGIAL